MTPVAHPTKKNPTPSFDPQAGPLCLSLMHLLHLSQPAQPELHYVLEPSYLSRTQVRYHPSWTGCPFQDLLPLSIPRASRGPSWSQRAGSVATQKAGPVSSGLVSVSFLGLPQQNATNSVVHNNTNVLSHGSES